MGSVVGRVFEKHSGRGAPGLVVTAYALSGVARESSSRRRRLASVATGPSGAFALKHEEGGAAPSERAEQWDLLVTVEASADGGGAEEAHHVLLAAETRNDAAPRETFRFAIEESRFESVGLIVPAPPGPDELISRQRAADDVRARLDEETRRRFANSVRRADDRRGAAAQSFKTFLEALSSVPAGRRLSGTHGYVQPGANRVEENLRVMRETVTGPLSQATAVSAAVLEDQALEQLKVQVGGDLDAVPATVLAAFAWPWKTGRPGLIAQKVPLRKQCGGPPPDDCVKFLEGEPLPADEHEGSQEGGGGTATGNGAEPASGDHPSVATLVHIQEDTATSPETPVSARAVLGDVNDGVDTFFLHSGPADTPALFDFHHLSIAFEPVWEELFDIAVLNIGESLYGNLVEAGVDPNKYLFGDQSALASLESAVGKAISSLANGQAGPGPIPASVIQVFEITDAEWDALGGDLQQILEGLADKITGAGQTDEEQAYEDEKPTYEASGPHLFDFNAPKPPDIGAIRSELRKQGERMVEFARSRTEGADTFDQYHKLLKDLDASMKEPYRFNIYAADAQSRSVNFGIVVTYRQRWEPVSYQVGELVKTIPLAPKESRRFTKRTLTRRSRAEKEVTNSLQSRRTESSDTWRAEAEIVQKAMSKTNFQLGAEGGVNIGIANASASSALSQETSTESAEVKKEFREAVFKAADEYKEERTLQIETSDSMEASVEESGELLNPNDEIAVTYLFYQLQRRFRVSEEIRTVTPVVLVAQEFPNPNDIDEDWIVAHDWILRRVILDDSFVPALNYLSTKVVGDEVALRELYKNVEQHRKLVKELKNQLVAIHAQVGSRYASLEIALAQHADAVQQDEEGGDIIPLPVGAWLTDGSDVSPEAMRLREDAARDAYERAAKEEKEFQARLDRETTALASITDTYTKSLSDHLNRRAQIERLRVHVEANIFYYMQAIWSYEPPDQRYFRLRDVPVPRLEGELTFKVEEDPNGIPLPPDWKKPHKLTGHVKLDTAGLEFDANGWAAKEHDALGEIADLDNLLGFKGNYMIFALREGNDLTEFLMAPYYDSVSQLVDPDPLGNWTLHDFVEYTCCLRKELSRDAFEKKLPGLIEAYRLLKERGAEDEEIIVPTDSLYIEALPGVHPVLEDFKLLHRAIDVKRAQADLRGTELENVRLAARILEDQLEDPTIEKKIVVENADATIVADG